MSESDWRPIIEKLIWNHKRRYIVHDIVAATIVVYMVINSFLQERLRAQLASSLSLNRTVSRQPSTGSQVVSGIGLVVSGITGGMASPRLLRNIIPEFMSLLIFAE